MKIYDPHITGSLSVSSSADIQGDLTVGGTIYGTAEIQGSVESATSASHAASYVLTSSYEIFTASVATTGSNTFKGDQTFSGSLIPEGTTTHDLGSDSKRWNDIYLAGSTVDIGGTKISKDSSGDVEIKDSDGNLKRLIASELEIGTGNNKIKIKRGTNGRVNILDGNDNEELSDLSGSFTGSFRGDGRALTGIPASAVTGLSLDRIASTTATASISSTELTTNVSIIPDQTDTIDLGSPSKQWRDLYLSSGSLYINGQQVLSTTGTELRVTTDSGESIKILEEGSDTITLQSENGDITLTSSGTGNIELDAPIQITAGNKVLSSDGNSIVFGNGLIITGSITLTGNVDGVDVGTFKSTFDTTTGSFDGRLDSLETNSGSQATSIGDLETFQTNVETGIQFTGSNVTIKGDLLVKGTETRVNSTTVDIADNIISLNGSGAVNAGIEVRDSESPGVLSGSLIYDTGDNQWKGGLKGSEKRLLDSDDLTTLNSSIDSLESESGSVKQRLNEVEFTTGSHNTRISGLETISGSHDGRLDSLETKTGSLTTDISTLDGRVDSLETKTGSLDTTNTSQNSRLTALETKSGSVDTKNSTQDGRLDSIESFTGSLDATFASDQDVTTLRNDLNTYTSSNDTTNTTQNSRLSSIETESGSIRSDFNTYTSSNDTTNTSQSSKIASLEEFTASIDDTYATDSDVTTLRNDLNTYTSSNDTTNTTQNSRLGSLETKTGSLDTTNTSQNSRLSSLETESGSIRSDLNTYTSSNDSTNTTQNSRLGSLETKTGSLETTNTTQNSRLTSIETFTGSIDDTYATDADVTTLSNRVGSLETKTGSLDTTNTTQNSRLSSLETKTGSLDTTNTSQNNRLGSIETKTGSLSTEIATERGRIDAILDSADADKDSFAEIVSLINSVDTDNDNAFASHFTSSNNRLSSLETVSSSHDGRLDSIEISTGSINERLGEIEYITGSHDGRLDSLETKTGSLDTTNTTQNSRLSSIETKTGSLDTTNTSQNSRLSSLETKTGSLDTKNTTQDSRLSSIETKTGSLSSDITTLDGRVDSIESFTASLDDTYATDSDVTTLRGDLNTYTSSNDATNTTQNSRLTSIESFTGSIDDTYATDSDVTTLRNDFNTHTSSNDSTFTSHGLRLSSIETKTGSLSTDVSTNLSHIQTITGTTSNHGGRISSLETKSGSHSGRLDSIESFTGSLDNTYATDIDVTNLSNRVDSVETFTSSIDTTIKTKLNTETVVSGSEQIDIHNTTGYVANENIDHSTITLGSGKGLTGGGTIDVSRSLTLHTGSAHFTGGVKTKLDSEGVISGSGQITLSDTNGYSTITDRLDSVEDFTASLDNTYATDSDVTTLRGDLNTYTSSNDSLNTTQNGRLTSIESTTASLDGRLDTIEGGLQFTGSNVTVKGNLLVKGTETRVNSTTVDIQDNIISLNGNGAVDPGIEVRDTESPGTTSGSLIYDTANHVWKGGLKGSEYTLLDTRHSDTVTGQIESLETESGSIRTDFNNYTSSNDSTTVTQNNRLGSLETKTGSLDTTNTTQNSRLGSLETKTGSLDTDITNLDGRLDSIEGKTGSFTTTDYFTTGATFNSSNGVVTGTRNDGNTWTVDLDGRYLTSFTESDPVFDAHVASNITSTNISNWNTAYGWGDHSVQGYLTSYNNEFTTGATFNSSNGIITFTRNDGDTFSVDIDGRFLTSFTESDPIFTAHAAYGITSTNISNWDTAYGWGDHSQEGYLTSHPSVVAADSSDNSGRTYIQDILLDGNGHVTGITTATESVVNTDEFTTGATFNSSNGVITFTRNDGDTFTVDIDGRFLTSFTESDPIFTAHVAYGITSTNISNWNTAYGWGDHSSAGYLTSLPSHNHDDRYYTETEIGNFFDGTTSITGYNRSNWNTAYGWGDHSQAGYLTSHPNISAASSSNNSGRTYIQDILLDGNGHVTGITTASESVVNTDEFVTGATFNNSNAVLTFTRNDGDTFTVTLLDTLSDVTVTGGTYNSGNQTLTLTKSDGNTVDVSGFAIDTDVNYYLDGLSFNSSNGVLTASVNGATDQTVDLDGRYVELGGGTMTGGLITTNLQVHGGSAQIVLKDTTDDDDHSILFRNNADGDDYKITTKDFTSAATGDGLYIGSTGGDNVALVTNNTTALDIDTSQNSVFAGNVTASSFIKSGGTSSQFLKADGSVDSSTYLTSHPSISAASSSNNSGRTYVQDILLDSNGHITGITTATETVVNTDTDTNIHTTGATFNSSNGVVTFTKNTSDTYTVDLDGRYLTSFTESDPIFTAHAAYGVTSTKISNWDTAYGWGDHSQEGYLTSYNNEYTTGATFNSSNGIITFTRNDGDTFTVDIDGRFLTSYTESDTLQSVTDRGATTTNDITISHASTPKLILTDTTNNLTGQVRVANSYMYLNIDNPDSVASSRLVFQTDGVTALYLDQNQKAVFEGNVDVTGDIDMGNNVITDTKVGQWDTAYGWGDHGSAGYLTSHPNISAASSSDNGARTYIQDILLDSNGHVTGITTATETVTNTDTNHFTTGATFNTGNGIITFTDNKGDTYTVDIDGRFLTSFTESDPVFTAHVAYGITSTNISNWNTAYGWGDHSSEGYLTSFDITTQTDSKYLRSDTDDTTTGTLTIGDGSTQSRLKIQKADNNTADHIEFYNGTTRVGEIGVSDNTWLRLNNYTNKNIYTPRYIRADNGFFVDGTSKGINASGNFIGGTIAGASDANVSNWDTAYGWGDHSQEGYLTSYNDEYTTGATFNSTSGVLTFTRNDGDQYTVNLVSTLSDVTVTGGTYNSGNQTLTLTKSDGNTVSVSGFAIDTDVNWYTTGATFNTSNGVITGTHQGGTWTVDLDGRYLTSESYTQHDNISAASSSNNSGRTYIQDILLDSNGHVTGITTATETVTNTDTNDIDYISSASFNTGTGVITGTGTGNAGFTVDIDGRYVQLSGGGSLTGDYTITGDLDVATGGIVVSGSKTRGTYTSASNYHSGADNIILKGNSSGISGIFFESEKDGTNINHASDFGFIQFHPYGTGTSGESNELIIGVSNDSDDHLIFNAPNAEGLRFRVGSSETDYKLYHEGHVPTWSEIASKPSTFTPSSHNQAWSTITSTPTTIAGYGITDAFDGTWASLSGKPSTFTPSSHNHDTRYPKLDVSTASSTWTSSEQSQYSFSGWDANGASWTPDTGWWWGMTLPHVSNTNSYNYSGQIIVQNSSGANMYVRTISNSSQNSWKQVWTSNNFANNSSNWNTAYGWGDHSQAGYLTSSSTQSKYLRSDTADTFTGTITMGTQKALVANNYGRGVYGLYSASRYQHVWSMGTSYNLSDDGTSTGNLYGLAFTHTNVGGQSKSGLAHQLLIMDNGTTKSAIGRGIWTDGTITATGDLVLGGGDITSSSTGSNVNVFATTTGTVTYGGGAVNIGSAANVTTIEGAFTVKENSTFQDGVSIEGDLTVQGGDLTINKEGNYSEIIFPAQTNDPGFIRHYESSNTSRMEFSVSDDSGTTDQFHFGYSGDLDRFIIYSNGSFHARGTGTVEGHFTPHLNDTYDLGSSSKVWRNIYTGDLHLSNMGKSKGNDVDGTKGNWTIQEGAENLYIINNNNGKKFRVNLEEV